MVDPSRSGSCSSATTRKKDGKLHRYWSIVENCRLRGGRVQQRHVLYLGEIDSSQERAWRRSMEVFDEGANTSRTFRSSGRRWRDVFQVSFDVLRYDLTSTCFEANPPFDEGGLRQFGHARDHRPDCVQVVVARVVTPQGLALAYEVMPGNTNDSTTLRGFLDRIEHQYGQARRVGVMDRGIATEAVLARMRTSEPPVH